VAAIGRLNRERDREKETVSLCLSLSLSEGETERVSDAQSKESELKPHVCRGRLA